MTVEAILFDADGVVQHPAAGRREAFGELLGPGRTPNVDAFLEDLFAAEKSALVGTDGFAASLEGILRKWQCRGSVDDLLRAWTMIDVYADIADAIRVLRRSGIGCH